MINLSIKIPELNIAELQDRSIDLLHLIKNDLKFKSLLESGDYEQLYNYVDRPGTRGYLTRLLYSLGIDPLLHMNYVPNDFLCFQKKPIRANIPDNISYLGVNAFSDSGLIKISLPASLIYIDNYSFFNVPHLKTIEFRGTGYEWIKISKEPDWISETTRANVKIINCIDGEIEL